MKDFINWQELAKKVGTIREHGESVTQKGEQPINITSLSKRSLTAFQCKSKLYKQKTV